MILYFARFISAFIIYSVSRQNGDIDKAPIMFGRDINQVKVSLETSNCHKFSLEFCVCLCRVWILVIHYAFADGKAGKPRPGNDQDVKLLQKLFREYEDCTFREIASPQSNEIAQILSEDGIVSRFEGTFLKYFLKYCSKTRPPSVFMLFILSHGGENGKIFTEQEGDSFTMYDVWDALAGNELLQNCLKINVLGVRVRVGIISII
jgi:hypothetical protein